MREEVRTCPDCGALITPQLSNCRQCGRYLHGTKLEGFLFQHLLPEGLRNSPGTGLMMLVSVLYYGLMVMFAGIESAPGFTSFSVRSLGSASLTGILQGQYWRFVTSAFAHADLLHIAFNLYALSISGRLVEQAFDKKKMLIIYLLAGVLGMVISYVWHYEVLGGWFNSLGASGAVCGMVGAAMVAGHRMGPAGADVKKAMLRWAIYLLIFGLAVGGIDNAAHVGGFAVGAGLAFLFPMGLTQSVAANRGLSVVVLAMFAGVLACIGLMLMNLKGFPASLEEDAQPRTLFFFTYAEGTPYEFSSQTLIRQDCLEKVEKDPTSDDTVRRCELALRANPDDGRLYLLLAQLHAERGEDRRAEQLRRTLKGLQKR